MRSKVETYSLEFLFNYFNKEIKEIDINVLNKRLYKRKRVDKKQKFIF